jgi:LAO/AO transport system kinase
LSEGKWTLEALVEGIRGGDRRALARAITLIENSDALAYELIRRLYPDTGKSYSVGVTGPPGVGKSSLISMLVRHVRVAGASVGVISVDPSSPFTQGALLGDRIRLADHFLDPEVFIRSMGTRGHLGGIAEATLQAALVLDAAGKDLLFLETVGAGQSEVEIISIADTVVLVLMPGSGDSIQALKAGIMEIPDVIAVNKRDHPAAKTMVNEVRSILSLGEDTGWQPPIVLTEAVRGEGIEELPASRGGRLAGGASSRPPRGGGIRRGERARKDASRARGCRRPRAPPPARGGATPRARPADRRSGDHGEGIQNFGGRWLPEQARQSLTSKRRVSASPASRAVRLSIPPRRSAA